MRKKLFLFIFLCVSCLGLFSPHNFFAEAQAVSTDSEIIYEISNTNQSGFGVENNKLGISTYQTSWKNVLTLIYTNSSSTDKISLHFNNFNLNKTNDSTLEFYDSTSFVISGEISSNLSSPIFTVSSNLSSTIEFANLSITCPNSNFVIYSNNSNSTIILGENLIYTNLNTDQAPYLTNYNRDTSLIADSLVNTKLKIFVPYYDLANEKIIECSLDTSNNIEIFYPSSNGYSVSSNYSTSREAVTVSSSINYTFDTVGGTYKTLNAANYYVDIETGNYIISYPYQLDIISSINFNNQGNLTRPYATFNGWFGKVNFNGNTYYFDTNMLAMFMNSTNDFNQLTKYFTTNIEKLDNNFAVLGYSNANSNDYAYFGHLKFFLDNGLTPTYIAKWTNAKFNISFVSNCDAQLETKTICYGEAIPEFENITKTGYTFAGWYTDSELLNKFTSETMPARNFTLYAKWNINLYNLNFNTNGGSSISPVQYEYNADTQRPVDPEKEGYNFAGWYKDTSLNEEYTFDKMPANDVTIYAKWDIKHFTIYILPSNNSSGISMGGFEYGSEIPNIPPFDQTGYNFIGWYSDRNFQNQFNFNQTVKSDIYIYAKLEPITYTITFVTNCNITLNSINGYYSSIFTLPNNLSKTGYSFAGWYTDENFENVFTLNVMPANNITLYAKWIQKQILDFELNIQSCTFGEDGILYKNDTGISGLSIYYYINGEWTLDSPTEIGIYDIRVTRNEDELFQSVDKVLEAGLKVLRPMTNLGWLIAFLYFATFAEIAVSILVRYMRKRKMSTTFVLIGTTLISSSQFVHLIISGVMCLAGFVYMVYQLVELSRTVNNENFAPSKENNRERFRSELVFQNDKKNSDLDFKTETKTSESFGDKYSNSDIEAMLEEDTFSQRIKSNRKGYNSDVEDEDEADNYSSFDRNYDRDFQDDDYNNLDEEENLDSEENIMPQSHYDILNSKDSENDSDADNDDIDEIPNDTLDE